MNSWPELWHHFTATLAQQPVAAVLAIWVGLALVVVMALEGLLLNLFPGCVFHRYLEKMPERKKKSVASQPAAKPAAPPPPAVSDMLGRPAPAALVAAAPVE